MSCIDMKYFHASRLDELIHFFASNGFVEKFHISFLNRTLS